MHAMHYRVHRIKISNRRATQRCNVSAFFYAKICSLLARRRSSQPVQRVYWPENVIDWLGKWRPTCVMRHARGQKLQSFRRKWPFYMNLYSTIGYSLTAWTNHTEQSLQRRMDIQNKQGETSGQQTPLPNTETGQNAALVNQVFSMFKGYLTSQLEEKGNQLQSKATIEKQATEFKYKGNRKQFEFNAEIDEIITRIDNNAEEAATVRELVTKAKAIIKKRQKLIKIADKSKDGWLVVEEYESDDLASDTDDEKRLKKARSVAEKRRKETSRGNETKKLKTDDNRFFRGEFV